MKKFLTFAAAILLLAAIGLSLASCGGSKAGETYKILGYNRTEKDVNMELRVTSDTFSFSASGESTEGGYSINGTEGLSGSLKTDGDIVICDGDILSNMCRVETVFIEGKKVYQAE